MAATISWVDVAFYTQNIYFVAAGAEKVTIEPKCIFLT